MKKLIKLSNKFILSSYGFYSKPMTSAPSGAGTTPTGDPTSTVSLTSTHIF